MTQRKTVGIVGCGAIGSTVAEHIDKSLRMHMPGMIACDLDDSKTEHLRAKIPYLEVVPDINEVVRGADIVVETASGKIVPELLRKTIDAEKDTIIISIGGLLGHEGLLEEARRKGVKILLPSGAIAGIDALKAAKLGGIKKVTLTTRKGPGSIKGAPYLEEKGIDVDSIKEETVVFEGNAHEAIKGFPKNVNVSSLLSIAGIGPDRTTVRIIVSPSLARNVHEITVESVAGVISIRIENLPSPSNPRTSYLAALSVVAAIEGYFDPVRIGT